MFPVLNGTSSRTFVDKSRVIGGVLLTQTRGKNVECSSLPDNFLRALFSDTCLSVDEDDISEEPFGIDPTFISTETSLYRATNDWHDFYDSSEMQDEENAIP